MALDSRVSDTLSRNCIEKFGMTFDEFNKLSFCEQQKLLEENRKKQKNKKSKYVNVLFGYGEHSSSVKIKRGEKVMIRYGNIIEAGLTPEEERKRIDDAVDEIIFGKPATLVKKLKRKFNIKKN